MGSSWHSTPLCSANAHSNGATMRLRESKILWLLDRNQVRRSDVTLQFEGCCLDNA